MTENKYDTHRHSAWHTGKMCKCETCYCCEVYRSTPIPPLSNADALIADRNEQNRRSADSWNSYMHARLNNR